jgi:alpha-L-arabinofuranosidase
VILKVVNVSESAREVRLNISGARQLGKAGKAFVLSNSDLKSENSLTEPMKVAPVERPFEVAGGNVAASLAPYSLTVFRIPMAAAR